MYYEEKIINGVLMCRTTPDGEWRQASIEKMGQRIIEMKAEIESLSTLRVTQERDQLLALNASFSEAIKSASDTFRRLDEQGAHIIGEEDVFLNLHVLYEKLLIINPVACLADIQAKAIEDAAKQVTSVIWPEDSAEAYDDALIAYTNQLRQQSTISK